MNDLVSKSMILRMMDENIVVFRSEIEKMPVIDAIPVEWLEKQIKECSVSMWSLMCSNVLNGWKDEQEAE